MASCTSLCDDTADEAQPDESGVAVRCSGGTGCCRADIIVPTDYDSSDAGTSKYDVQLTRMGGWNRSTDLEHLPVRVFVADNRWFDNSSISNDLLQTGRPWQRRRWQLLFGLRGILLANPTPASARATTAKLPRVQEQEAMFAPAMKVTTAIPTSSMDAKASAPALY
ncbi:Wall-associated receptor kinase 2 [Hordeum vulgare]|nr:Wall-associated receptor kinase 2 [Hordeum vulgare]